jgi:hypothetical protein
MQMPPMILMRVLLDMEYGLFHQFCLHKYDPINSSREIMAGGYWKCLVWDKWLAD